MKLSPRVPAAVLRIPQQKFDSPEQLDFAQGPVVQPVALRSRAPPARQPEPGQKADVLRALEAAPADERRRALRADRRRSLSVSTTFEASLEDRNAADYADFLLPELGEDFDVLDVGCGTGTITLGLAETVNSVIGVDQDDEEFTDARRHAAEHGIENVEFRVGSAYALDFPAEHFDACLCHSVLEALDRPDDGLLEIKRALKPGGVLGVAWRRVRRLDPRRPRRRASETVLTPFANAWAARKRGGSLSRPSAPRTPGARRLRPRRRDVPKYFRAMAAARACSRSVWRERMIATTPGTQARRRSMGSQLRRTSTR